MRFLLLILLLGFTASQAQDLNGFELVDETEIRGLTLKVYFKDPLKLLSDKHPNFDKKEDKIKHELLLDHLHNNTLYLFETSKNSKIKKRYLLVGNPQKIRTRNYFQLEIRNSENLLENIVDQINVGGTFFEHMKFFQNPQGKQYIGKGIQIWGYFTMVQSYSPIKDRVVKLIEMDLDDSLPDEILAKKVSTIEPLFEYQKCGLSTINKRTLTITVFQYDSVGGIKNRYPRTEMDTQLYLSSTSKDLIGVTSFPYFSSSDKIEKIDDIILVNSKLENINHYLGDIKLKMSKEGYPERIEGRLFIHGYSANGPSEHDERYVAEFSKVGNCYLPSIVKLCPPNDLEYKKPRLTIEIEYETK